jgi:hypothetical protein
MYNKDNLRSCKLVLAPIFTSGKMYKGLAWEEMTMWPLSLFHNCSILKVTIASGNWIFYDGYEGYIKIEDFQVLAVL